LGKLKIGNFGTFYEIINTVLKTKAQLDSQAELSDYRCSDEYNFWLFDIFWSTVPYSEFLKHDDKSGAKRINGFNVENLLRIGIKEDIEIGCQVIFRPPVANQKRHLR
jgi:hypothetical protein